MLLVAKLNYIWDRCGNFSVLLFFKKTCALYFNLYGSVFSINICICFLEGGVLEFLPSRRRHLLISHSCPALVRFLSSHLLRHSISTLWVHHTSMCAPYVSYCTHVFQLLTLFLSPVNLSFYSFSLFLSLYHLTWFIWTSHTSLWVCVWEWLLLFGGIVCVWFWVSSYPSLLSIWLPLLSEWRKREKQNWPNTGKTVQGRWERDREVDPGNTMA